jgi:lipopolysaccharide export LptBFGC system permease protein LptF
LIEVALVVVQLALQIALPWWIVRSDMKRLDARALARTWNDASFWSAVVAFGALSIPVHFLKSRRSLRGFVLGLGWMLLAVALVVAVSWTIERATG